jgi:hypothetical protein
MRQRIVSRKSQKLYWKHALVLLLSIAVIVGAVQTVKAAEITRATSDSDAYLAGQTGYISASVYNDRNEIIRVNELSATVDYYYTDGTVYIQKFFTSTTLPTEIQPGQTESFRIPISLPTNIAPGFIDLIIEARTEFYVNQTDRWIGSDTPTYKTTLYIESPYKQSYENSQQHLLNTQQSLEKEKADSRNLGYTAIVLTITTLVFAGLATFLLFTLRKPKPIAQPK